MARNFIYPVLRCVLWVEYYCLRWGGDVDEVRACILELRFLHLCLWWVSRYDKDDGGEGNWENLKSVLHAIVSTWENLQPVLDKKTYKFTSSFEQGTWRRKRGEFLKEIRAITSGKEHMESTELKMDYLEFFREEKDSDCVGKEQDSDYVGEVEDWNKPWLKAVKAIENWNLWSSQIKATIEKCKLHIRGQCANLLHCTFIYKSAPSADQMFKFLHAILQHLQRVAGEKIPLKNQIEAFEEKLRLLEAFFKLIPDDGIPELRDFRKDLYDDINKVAWLTFLFWAKAGDEEITAELNLILSDMLLKIIKPSVPDVSRWYFGVLKAMQLQNSNDALLLGHAVTGFVDMLFEYLGIASHEGYQILRDGLIILFTFLANPPKEYAEYKDFILIRDQLGDILLQGSCPVPPVDDTKEVHLRNLRNLVAKIERLKAMIRKLHNGIPDSFSCYFPRTNGLGFIDFLLQNLKDNLNSDKMSIPFAKHLILQIQQELVSLRPDLDAFFELQKEHEKLQDIWQQLVNLAYLTEHAVNSCSVILYPIWYNMVRLADILDEMKVIKGKLDAVNHSYLYNAILPKSLRSSNVEIPTRTWYSGANEVMVGCQKEVDKLVDQLTRGPKSLEIVSIFGMGGSGKTTLARKIYDSRQVRSSFHIFAFCTVSQVYSTRRLLLEILNDIEVNVDNINSKTDDDLAHHLHKKLSGKRYIVVMDDIWKIDAWEKVKSSFPNDNQGSRVIFTTREHEVATNTKSKFNPHSKSLLSDNESWELMQTIVFPKTFCPRNLSNVGQVIARNCRGLPLAVVVIGRLLARKERSPNLWNEIAAKTSSFASEEGCQEVLELSYKHLPEHLKSCFLYLGVFEEDEFIRAERLLNLWIAEGFVQKSQKTGSKLVGKEYLSELVERSLVQVTERSYDNGIKTCQLHDVIRDFCQKKALEENFFHLIRGVGPGNSSNSNRYHLCLQMCLKSFVDAEVTSPDIKSLLYHYKSSHYCGCDGSEFNFLNFQLVQVLDLEDIKLFGGKAEVYRVIESMTSLIHLRYLAVTIDDGDIGIPSQMADLKYLETLIFRRSKHASYLRGSGTLWKMKRLRHLDVGRCWFCPYQPEFETHSPLYNVECFSILVLKPRTAMTLLQKLPNIRKLNCAVNDYWYPECVLAFHFLSKLESLKVHLSHDVHMTFPVNLKKLSLRGCVLSSQLGKLPYLKVLKVDDYRVTRWDIEDGEFPMLKFLKLRLLKLREWNAPCGSFPRLEQLVLVDCKSLHEIPASFAESSTMKRIEVHSSSSSLTSSVCEVRDELKELGIDTELIITNPEPEDVLESEED